MSDDPLRDNAGTDRLFYAVGTLLDDEDLRAEQTYHRGRLARALAYLHGLGTVAGLEVVMQRATGDDVATPTTGLAAGVAKVSVRPGLALDALGRLVEVPQTMCISVADWVERNRGAWDDLSGATATEVVAAVFLRSVSVERGRTPAFASSAQLSVDAVRPARVRDGFELDLARAPLTGGERAEPERFPLPLAGAASRDTAAFRRAVFDAWKGARERENGRDEERERLRALHRGTLPEGRDPEWIFLADVRIGVARAQNVWQATGAVAVSNDRRVFAITPAAIARWLGVAP